MSRISVLQSLNGAQFLKATCVAAASGCFLSRGLSTAAAVVLVTTLFPVTKTYSPE